MSVIAEASLYRPSPYGVSPLAEDGGLLVLKADFLDPKTWCTAARACVLFGMRVELDHVAIAVDSEGALKTILRILRQVGCRIVEGPGHWPTDFCSDLDGFPSDLAMFFATALLPSELLLVLAAPCERGDQIDRFRAARGPAGVHHAAIRVQDLSIAVHAWARLGFAPARPSVDDGHLQQVFLKNKAGQIIELIQRRNGGLATFSCSNIAALRRAEG